MARKKKIKEAPKLPEPQSRDEKYLNSIITGVVEGLPEPQSRQDRYLYYIAQKMAENKPSESPEASPQENIGRCYSVKGNKTGDFKTFLDLANGGAKETQLKNDVHDIYKKIQQNDYIIINFDKKSIEEQPEMTFTIYAKVLSLDGSKLRFKALGYSTGILSYTQDEINAKLQSTETIVKNIKMNHNGDIEIAKTDGKAVKVELPFIQGIDKDEDGNLLLIRGNKSTIKVEFENGKVSKITEPEPANNFKFTFYNLNEEGEYEEVEEDMDFINNFVGDTLFKK